MARHELLEKLAAGYAADQNLLDADMIVLAEQIVLEERLKLITPTPPMKQVAGEVEAMLRHRNKRAPPPVRRTSWPSQ